MLNREKLSKLVAQELANTNENSTVGSRNPLIHHHVCKILENTIVDLFVNCEISISTAMDVLERVKQTIADETVINREAHSKDFFA